jgi:hypothetical protein
MNIPIFGAIIATVLRLSTVFGAIECTFPSSAYNNVVRWDYEYLMETPPAASSYDIGEAFLCRLSAFQQRLYLSLFGVSVGEQQLKFNGFIWYLSIIL